MKKWKRNQKLLSPSTSLVSVKIHLNLGQYKFNAHLYSHESESERDVASDGFIENPV